MWLLQWIMELPHKVKIALAWVGAALTALAAFKIYIETEKKDAVTEYEQDVIEAQNELRRKSREAVAEEKERTSGVPDSTIIDRLRRRGDDWGRL